MSSLIAAFNQYFEIIFANTPELLEEAYRLRYKVLCIEQRLPGFEASKYSHDLEKDDYDQHSVHILVRHKPSNTYVGTARLILADPANPDKPFPIEKHTELYSTAINTAGFPRKYIAEISRLIILNRFPHHTGRRGRTYNVRQKSRNNLDIFPRFPYPTLALFVGIMRMSTDHNIKKWYAVIDPAVNRLLKIFNLHLQPIGPITEYYGIAQAHFADIKHVMNRAYTRNREVWSLLTDCGKIWPEPIEEPTETEKFYTNKIHHPNSLQGLNY